MTNKFHRFIYMIFVLLFIIISMVMFIGTDEKECFNYTICARYVINDRVIGIDRYCREEVPNTPISLTVKNSYIIYFRKCFRSEDKGTELYESYKVNNGKVFFRDYIVHE